MDAAGDQHTSSSPRYTRRLSDKILIAFHQSCDQNDVETARQLLNVLDFMVLRQPTGMGGEKRRIKETLVAAHERLWQMHHYAAGTR
jgi:hypothetical protein